MRRVLSELPAGAEYFQRCKSTSPCFFVQDKFAGIKTLQLIYELAKLNPGSNSAYLIDLKLGSILLESIYQENISKLRAADIEKLEQVKKILDAKPGEKHSLHSLARTTGLNVSKLKKEFRQYYDCSVFEYLRAIRMQKALVMLASGDQPITQIALELGYENAATFSTSFKRQLGFSPIEVRKRKI
jgi:AraC-like DNA-binding protein